MSDRRLCDVVLAGGDVKVLGLVGALEVLDEHGYEVNRVAGTSSGSVVAALLAAGYRGRDLREVVLSMNGAALADLWPLARLPGRVGWPIALLRHSSLCRGAYLPQWLPPALAARGVHGFDDLPAPAPSPETPEPTGRDRLVIVAVDVTTGRLRRFPDDLDRYPGDDGERIDLSVVDAVRASAAVPFFYPPVRIGSGEREHVFVDGGIASQVPVGVFDSPPGRAPRWPTFALRFTGSASSQRRRVRGAWSLGTAVLEAMQDFYDNLSLDLPEVAERVIDVDVGDFPRMRFDLSAAERDFLLARGREAAQRFLSRWDETRYLTRRRRMAEVRDPG